MSSSTPRGSMRSRVAMTVGLVLFALLVIVALRELLRDKTPGGDDASAARAPSAQPPTPGGNPTAVSAPAFAHAPSASAAPGQAMSPPPPMSDDEHAVWLAMMERTRATQLEKLKYPPTSLPLVGKVDIIKPNHVEPTVRPLTINPDGSAGKVAVTLGQDRIFIADNEQATATFEATAEGNGHPLVTVTRALLSLIDPKTEQPQAPLATLSFHDDGVPPDVTPGDSIYSAYVPPTLGLLNGKLNDILVTVDITAGAETGSFLYHFASTGSPPAAFTGVVRAAIEQGSLAYHVGIDVYLAGNYNLAGRLFDSTGAPMVFLTFNGDLTTDVHEIVFTAYGKVLRDQNGVPPFVAKDLEGWMWIIGQYPDRQKMVILPGPFASAMFDMNLLTDQEWDSPEKSAKIQGLNDAIEAGPSQIAPVDSNGIPLPPVASPAPSH